MRRVPTGHLSLMSRRTACAGSRVGTRAAALAITSCVLTLALETRAAADTDLGSGGGVESEPAVGAFDAVRLSAGLPAPALTVEAASTAPVGELVPVTVTVDGVATSDEIMILERYATRWTAIGSAAVDATGVARLAVAESALASYRYRVRLAATTKHKAASREFRIDVIDEAPPANATAAETPTPEQSLSSSAAVESGALCGGEVRLRADGTPWVCTYDDDFDGDALDRRYWVPQVSATSGFYSGTATQPACVSDDPRTIGVRDGLLVLSAIVLDAPAPCGKKSSALTSGSVTHHGTFAQTYGRYEVRAKLPSYQGKGLQETFWLWPNDPLKYGSPHPASGEIDFGEFYSNHAELNIAVMHYSMDYSTISYQTNTNIYTTHWCKIRVGEFNTYTLEWVPGRMTILVNGTVCIVNNYKASNAPATNPHAPFDSPFFLSLSQLFGTTGNEFDPATGPREASTVVDWVRVWA